MAADQYDNSAWNDFCQQLKEAGEQVLANAPDNELDRVEGFRYLARLTAHSLGRFTETHNPARPTIGYNAPRIGGDNPDFLYGSCTIRGSYDYVIRGNRRDAFNIGIGSYFGGLGSGKGLQCSGYVLLNDLQVDSDGNFEIQVSRVKKAGNWLPVIDESNSLLIRQTVLQRGADQPAELDISCLTGKPESHKPVPLTAAAFDRALQTSGLFVAGVVGQFLHWTNTFKAHTNEILPTPPELLAFAQGDPNTRYYNGYFNLGEDEALVVDLDIPSCAYWNLQATNHWLESLDFLDYRTHVNHANAVAHDTGQLRLVITPQNPAVDNWIDTAGHHQGCISLRFIKAEAEPAVDCQLVKLSDLPGKNTER